MCLAFVVVQLCHIQKRDQADMMKSVVSTLSIFSVTQLRTDNTSVLWDKTSYWLIKKTRKYINGVRYWTK